MTATVHIPAHIDTLLLDLDGTLLDLAFDTHFWLEVVPEYYGCARGMTGAEALEKEITPRLRSAEGTLNRSLGPATGVWAEFGPVSLDHGRTSDSAAAAAAVRPSASSSSR